jgi:predicted component of type VI protein secretion system
LFQAAVSELRTEIQVMRQKDMQQLKTETHMITREVETLAQTLKEDVDSMKNEIALDMDNRKNETRSDHKEIDMTIQELNSKFTVKLGEVRTGLESTRWETIWKGLGSIILKEKGIFY